ncbi:unnamed protein product [Lepeophtheirus salmonis]|uniref:(salmon louse) hypothetical protein n=1 Tax=Lepeophtheirus salmonis TaxID=72036 RepID=A0A7R8CI11_LEPSM|nr:unnamed protein product [Lepeophtheirus salmonis]CAF2828241.1 unnamed protein product [Lepeophtheirus salmonis]
MSEKEVEEARSEIKQLEDEKEKQRDRLEKETVTSLNTLKTKLIEHRKKVEMLTAVEELIKARKENLLAVSEVEDLSYDAKDLKIKVEIEKMKLANEKFAEDKVSQPSNDKETPREDTKLIIEERIRTKDVPLLEEGTDGNSRDNDSDGFRLGEEASMSCYSNHSRWEEAFVKNTELLNHMVKE